MYVTQNSGLTRYSFTVNLDSCGTQFINDFEGATGQAYVENVLVLQVGIKLIKFISLTFIFLEFISYTHARFHRCKLIIISVLTIFLIFIIFRIRSK